MPYSSVSDVPDYVPSEHRKDWLTVFNSAYRTAQSKGKSKEDAESYAFAVANSRFGPKGRYVKIAKLSKETVLYFPPNLIGSPEGAYCSICVAFKGSGELGTCAAVSGDFNGPHGVCKIYLHGQPNTMPDLPVKLTKEQAGYIDGTPGDAFGGKRGRAPTKCGICDYFDEPASACEKVSGEIEGGACCGEWDPLGFRDEGLKRVLVYEDPK